MNKDTKYNVHPAFVEIIKQLTPDEARLLSKLKPSLYASEALIDVSEKYDKGSIPIIRNYTNSYDDTCTVPENISAYLENLERLKIITIKDETSFANKELYKPLEKSNRSISLKEEFENKGKELRINEKLFYLTAFGADFLKCCVINVEDAPK